VAVVIVGLGAATKSNALKPLVLARLRAILGCEASAASVRLDLSGRILVRGLVLRAPGLSGPAGVILDAPDIEIQPDWGAMLRGRVSVDALTLRRPVVRISQDENLRLNLDRLTPAPGGGALATAPSVDIEYATIEFGEHGDNWYSALVSTEVIGSLARRPGADSRYEISLTELNPGAGLPRTRAPNTRLSIVGELDLSKRTVELRLSDVDLRRFRDDRVPSRLQPIWRRMALDGAVRETLFTWSAEGGAAVEFALDNVSLNVPLPPEEGTTPSADPNDDLIEMRGVRGTVRFGRAGLSADLAGEIDELTGAVRLNLGGFGSDSAIDATIRVDEFVMGEHPRFVPYAPQWVKRNLVRFSGPTALVSGEVTLARAPPTSAGPSELSVVGRVEFKRGAAEYEHFRYPFRDMNGLILFDDREVRLVSITGVGPTGARLVAQGRIAPPTNGAEVDLEITAVDVPYDEHLLRAIPDNQKPLLDLLFSGEEYERLAGEGLVVPSAERESLASERLDIRRRLARAEGEEARALQERDRTIAERLERPVFDLAGPSRVGVRIERDLGLDSDFRVTIDVALPRAGVLPSVAPYPLVADGLSLVIEQNSARVEAVTMRGLTGAEASFSAAIGVAAGAKDYRVDASAKSVPIDGLFIAALPDERDERMGRSPRALAAELGLSGRADVSAHAFRRTDADREYSIEVALSDIAVRPPGSSFGIDSAHGVMRITESLIELEALTGSAGGAPATTSLRVERTPGSEAVSASAHIDGLDLTVPVEDLLTTLVPERTEALRRLREERRPRGTLDIEARYMADGAGTRFEARLENPRGVSFDILGGRLEIGGATGAATLSNELIECRGFETDLVFNGEPSGRLTLDGRWPVSAGAGQMTATLHDGRFESPAVRALASRADPRLGELLVETDAVGRFDAEGRATVEPGAEAGFVGELRPRSLTLRRRGREIVVPSISGVLAFQGRRGEVRDLSLRGEGWSIDATGKWSAAPALAMGVDVSLRSEGLPPDLRAMLPEDTDRLLDQARLQVEGPLTIEDARIELSGGVLALRGRAESERLSFLAGAAFDARAVGAAFEATIPESSAGASVRATIEAPSLNVGGVQLDRSRMSVRSGETPGSVLIPDFLAQAHGGEVSARVVFAPMPPVLGAQTRARTFARVEVQSAGVDFASLLRDFSRVGAGFTDASEFAPGSRGWLDGTVAVEGVLGESGSRRGRGIVRVQGAEVINLPGVLPLLRLSNLQLPIGERVDFATATFFLRGERMEFEVLEAASPSVVISGTGTIDWPGANLDLRFSTRGRDKVPILSDILKGLRDEFVTSTVRGTLNRPEYVLEHGQATRRMLGTIFRGRTRDDARGVPAEPERAPDTDP